MSSCSASCEALNTGNDILILHEIRHALGRLLAHEEATTIDLRSIPMAPGEEARIEEMLGEGEINVRMNALGPSTIKETGIAGVWLITHFNTGDEILGKYIEISRMPEILLSPLEDIENGLQDLERRLSG